MPSEIISQRRLSDDERRVAVAKWKNMDEKEKRSCKAGLRQYYATNTPDPDGQSCQREEWMPSVYNWIDFSEKYKETVKESVGEEIHKKGKEDMTDYHRWGKFQVLKELGPDKGQSWIDSKLMLELPDLMTKKTGEWDIEYVVPVAWSRMTATELKAFTLRITAELGIDDVAAHRELGTTESSNLGVGLIGGAQHNIQVKEEKGAEQSRISAEVDALLANVKATLQKWQGQHTELKEVINAGESEPSDEITDKLFELAKKSDVKHNAIIRIMTKMVGSKNVCRIETANLIKLMNKASGDFAKVHSGAVGFGFVTELPLAGSKRRKTSKRDGARRGGTQVSALS